MKETSVCFTGHRLIPPSKTDDITNKVREIIAFLINEGYDRFYAGGAWGFDTLAAEAVLEFKAVNPAIQLILVLPHLSQSKGWTDDNIRKYHEILQSADKVICLSKTYFRGCMQVRNRYLVDHSSVCVCYLTEDFGGTFQTVHYASQKSLHIYHIADNHPPIPDKT